MKKILTLLALTALFAIGTVKLFGTTVSSKFQQANAHAVSHVTFGGSPTQAARTLRSPTSGSRPTTRTESNWTRPLAKGPTRTETRDEAVSTFAIDVDTGSYTIARRELLARHLPATTTVRPEEFVNYFTYDYPRPPDGSAARVSVEAAPSPFAHDPRTYLVRVGLQAAAAPKRVPVHLTFLVDVSGSMSSPDRLPLAKEAILRTASALGPRDTVAIATYSGGASVALEPTSASKRDRIEQAVSELRPGGGTAMGDGMNLAYDLAVKNAGRGVSRVIVLSDGDANIGAGTPQDLLGQIRSRVEEGVTMSTIGFGMGNYRDDLMEQLADAGDGNYRYIDSEHEVEHVFGTNIDGLLHVVAKDVKVQVEFDPAHVESWRLIGYENRAMENHEFRNDRADGGELGANHQVTAMYEIVLLPGAWRAERLGVMRFRHKKPDAHVASEDVFPLERDAFVDRIGDASKDFRFQASVLTFAEKLAGRSEVSWGWIEEVASDALDGRAERHEFAELVRELDRWTVNSDSDGSVPPPSLRWSPRSGQGRDRRLPR